MNKINVLSRKQQYFAVTSAVVLSLLVVSGLVFGATTISTNVNTGGTLTVSGDSYLANASTTGMLTAGNGFISVASSTVVGAFRVSGALVASSTATSTFQSGINLSTGCFSFQGTCLTSVGVGLTNANIWTGLQTFTAGYISNGSSTVADMLNVNGPVNASSTLNVAGLSRLTAGFVSTGSSTVAGQLNVNGPVNASSTLNVAGLSNLTGGYVSTGSSTVAGPLSVSGTVNASSTIFTGGDIRASSTATTTLSISAAGSSAALSGLFGGCIQLTSASGTTYRMYIGTNDLSTTTSGATAFGRASGIIALWEIGSCK